MAHLPGTVNGSDALRAACAQAFKDDLKPLADLRRASKLLGDYNVAKQGYAAHKTHEKAVYVPSGMCHHTWARHVNADAIRACETAAWEERIATLRSKIKEMGYDPDA